MDLINNYFTKKNINVSFNTLGANNTLANLFVKETQDIVKTNNYVPSNHVKQQCYARYYNMTPRDKYTGFEKFSSLDKKIRLKMIQNINPAIGRNYEEVSIVEEINSSYLDVLKKTFLEFKTPLVYLSGGIDSEFVAKAMIDSNIEFNPVIFKFSNDQSEILNDHDITYAFDFCFENNLTPIIREINVEKLWNTQEFIDLSSETQTSSPHINTYVYMVELMNEEYPDSTHVFGGEIRYKIVNKADKDAALVSLAKTQIENQIVTLTNTVPAGQGHTGQIKLTLRFNWNGDFTQNQTWQLIPELGAGASGTLTLSANSTSGNWYIGDAASGPEPINFESYYTGAAGYSVAYSVGTFNAGIAVSYDVALIVHTGTGEQTTNSSNGYDTWQITTYGGQTPITNYVNNLITMTIYYYVYVGPVIIVVNEIGSLVVQLGTPNTVYTSDVFTISVSPPEAEPQTIQWYPLGEPSDNTIVARINGGSWSAGPTYTVSNGDTIQYRATTGSIANTAYYDAYAFLKHNNNTTYPVVGILRIGIADGERDNMYWPVQGGYTYITTSAYDVYTSTPVLVISGATPGVVFYGTITPGLAANQSDVEYKIDGGSWILLSNTTNIQVTSSIEFKGKCPTGGSSEESPTVTLQLGLQARSSFATSEIFKWVHNQP